MTDTVQLPTFACDGPTANVELLGQLPESVRQRIRALKTIQLKSIDVESKFYERVHALEVEFEPLFSAIFAERKQIVVGDREPTAEETKTPLLHHADEETLAELAKNTVTETGEKGIKDFWLTVLRGNEITSEIIQEHDAPILSYLTDITSSSQLNPTGFSLHFHFAENPYFKNTVLNKVYTLDLKPDPEHAFDYDGPNVAKVGGDTIEWADGKNVTKKVVKKKQKKGANAGKFLTKTVKADSFFNFFEAIKTADERNEDEENDDNEELIHMDYEIGQTIRDSIIPRAVLFFTGEMQSDDMFDFNGEDDDDFSGEDDE